MKRIAAIYRKRVRRVLATLFSAAILVAGCGDDKNVYAPPPPPPVSVASPEVRDVVNHKEFTGVTEAVASVEVRARVSGYLEKVHFIPSSYVKQGDLLFSIDPKEFVADLEERKAALAVRKAEFELAEARLKRLEKAVKTRAVSVLQVLEARAERDQSKAAIQAAKAGVDKAALNLSYTKITAPISGRIGRSLVDVGNLVGAGGEKTLLTTIVQYDPMYTYFSVSEQDLLNYLRNKSEGKKAPVFYMALGNETDYPHEGRLDYIDNVLDPTTGTIRVRGIFPNEEDVLVPGLFARIQVPTDTEQNALLVPERALGADQGGRFLLVVNDENVVEQRPVEVGDLLDGMRVIRSGVDAKERIIVSGIQRARPGETVTPQEADTEMAGAEAAPEASGGQPAETESKSAKSEAQAPETGKATE